MVGKDTLEVMGEARWYNRYLIGIFSSHLKGNILEIGFGTGNFTRLLSEYGKVTAIEINDDYLKKTEGLDNSTSVGYGDVEKGKYFFNKSKFRTIVCINVLEHIDNDDKALRNISKLLYDGGKLILLVPAHQFLFSKFDKLIGHYRRYSKAGLLLKIKQAGWSIVSVKYFNWLSALGWLMFIKITGWRSLPKKEVGIFNKIAKFFLWTERYIEPPFGLSIILIAQK